MGFFREISSTSYWPLNNIRKGSKKFWRIVIGKNSSVYSVKRAFVRNENCRESRYSKLEMDDRQYPNSAPVEKNDEESNVQFINESDKEATIKSDETNQEITGENDEIIQEIEEVVEDTEETDTEKNEELSEVPIYRIEQNNEDFDYLPNRGKTFIVEVHMEISRYSAETLNDNTSSVGANEMTDKSSEDQSEQEENILLSDEISSSDLVDSESIKSEELKPEDSISQMEYEIEKTPPKKQTKITHRFTVESEIFSSEFKENRPENSGGNGKETVTQLVNLFEQQVTPSPIHKITSAKRQPFASRQNRIEFEKINSTEYQIGTPGISKRGDGKNRNSKEYDVIDYSSMRLESLMTQMETQNQPSTYFSFWESPKGKGKKLSPPSGKNKAENREQTITETEINNPERRTGLEENETLSIKISDLIDNFERIEINSDRQKIENDEKPIRDSRNKLDISYFGETSRESGQSNSTDGAATASYSRGRTAMSRENMYTTSFPDLTGLVETKVDSSCDSIPIELGESSRSKSSGKSRSDELDEITVEYATLERNKTRRNVSGRIPSFRMNKFQTLFKKTSLLHLYRFMRRTHIGLDIVETPINKDVEEKFVCNVYGPSMRKNKYCC